MGLVLLLSSYTCMIPFNFMFVSLSLFNCFYNGSAFSFKCLDIPSNFMFVVSLNLFNYFQNRSALSFKCLDKLRGVGRDETK